MRKIINIPPPSDFGSFTPSELFRFFFQIGHWTEDSFSDELQTFTRGTLVSTVTINKWKNRDVIPTRYAGPFLNLVKSRVGPGIAKTWVAAFETVWALHSAGRKQSKNISDGSISSSTICDQHQKWIKRLYAEPRPGEPVSPSDIYVPLQFLEPSKKEAYPQDIESMLDLLIGSENAANGEDWIFISGGPGSGKSMTALHLANRLCDEDIFPIFIRGHHLSGIDIDIVDPNQPIGDSFSPKSFLKNFRRSPFKTACLILDGLDEIRHRPQSTTNTFDQLISELRTEQAACSAHGKTLRIIGFGRGAHLQFSKSQLPMSASRHFELLTLNGSARSQSYPLGSVQGEDLRPVWWSKYLAATDRPHDPSLPDFLSTEFDDFSEFSSEPLLTYLICQTALERSQENLAGRLPHESVNALTYSSNRNDIYQLIIDRLSGDVRHSLNRKQFLSVLQHIALAAWHEGESRCVSLNTVHAYIQDEVTQASFRALTLSNPTAAPPDMLITAFYYRHSQARTETEESIIEFTHKTFSEYLISTLLFDRFTDLISAFEDSAIENSADLETALEDWAKLSRIGKHEPSLADFCQKEAALRFDALSKLNWDAALTLLQTQFRGRYFKEAGVSSISQMQHSCSLLFFIWSCLNLERQKRTGTPFHLTPNDPRIRLSDLKSFQRPNALNFQSGSKTEPLLRDVSLLTSSLSALQLTSADMSQLSFSLGHIESLICEDCSFAMTHWSHVKVTKSSFIRSVFQQAIFHQWHVIDSKMSHCLFQGSRFQGTTFSACHLNDTFFSQCHFSDVEFIASKLEKVVFDRCIFTQCTFTSPENKDWFLKAHFRHCTFIDMESALETIPSGNIENSISPKIGDAEDSPKMH